jgi:hypothetical protein
VTGSSRSLGKSIALKLAKSGQKLVINYVSDGSKGNAEATVVEEVKALGGDAIAVQAMVHFLTLPGVALRCVNFRCAALSLLHLVDVLLLLSVIETPFSQHILLLVFVLFQCYAYSSVFSFRSSCH